MTKRPSRYRFEDGKPCIDIAAKNVERLLDTRDAAAIRDRDLDPSVVTYLVEAIEDFSRLPRPVRVIFWLAEPCPVAEVESAYRAHFEESVERVARKNRQRLRMGASSAAVALVLLCLLFSLSQVLRTMTGALWGALAESLMVVAWIVLWRPVEVLLYDWIPFHQEKKLMERLLAAHIEVRAGSRPVAVHGAPTRTGVWTVVNPPP